MVGFGALMVADHYGIFSLGLLLTLAVGSALVATLTALPAVLFYVFPGRQVARQDEGQVATPST
jgi:predicted RND superfamily exporter protein